MRINTAVLGTGERFKKYYFETILRLQNESIIKLKFFYNRDVSKIKKYEEIFKCRVTNNIKELLSDKTIDLFIITLPIHLRKKLFLNKNFNSKFVLSETPLVNNLFEYIKFKKIFEKKNISYEIFEDKFYYDYPITNNNNLTKLSIYNKFWEHHALSCFFKINSEKLGKINFISRKVFYNLEIFTIVYKDVKLNYIFSLNKKNVDRSKGIIKAFWSNKKKKSFSKINFTKKDKSNALYKCINNLIFLKKKNMYSLNYLEEENTIITIIKILRKFNIKRISHFEIQTLRYFLKFFCFFRFCFTK